MEAQLDTSGCERRSIPEIYLDTRLLEIPSAFELGQLVRVDSAYDLANELLVNVTLPELQLRLIDSCQSEQLMLLKLQQFKISSSFWLDPGYHAPNQKALSFATHKYFHSWFYEEMWSGFSANRSLQT